MSWAYAHDRSETHKQPVARAQLDALWHSRTGALSTQVLHELYVATRKLAAPMGRATARKIMALLAQFPSLLHIGICDARLPPRGRREVGRVALPVKALKAGQKAYYSNRSS